MALNKIPCPECGAGLKSSSGFTIGQTVCCPKCETYFKVEEPEEEIAELEEEVHPKKAKASDSSIKAKTGKKPIKAATIADEDDEDEEEKEEDDFRPKKKKKKQRRDDDEEDERSYKHSPLRFAILGVLVIVMLVLGYFLYDKKKKEREDNKETTSTETPNVVPIQKFDRPINANPKTAGPKQPFNPGGVAQKSVEVPPVEDQACKALRQMGAEVIRDSNRRVVVVNLPDSNIGDNVTLHLKPLQKLYSLDLSKNPLTDALLEETEGSWPNLQELSLGNTKVTDKGIGSLDNHTPQLQRLDLTGNEGITDKGIASLVKLPLERLFISRTKVTDAGMESVRKLRKLEELYCGNNAVTDQGVANLKGMPYLKVLALADSQLTDKGLATLGSLKKLEFLVLDRTKVTDAGMAYLKGLTGLQRLRLAGTSVTAEGEATLMKAIPGLSIEREEGKLY